ncbi:hypothetical protein C4579_02315 [Candidatus Microgenomates bacterium]|nr:MAG: hypothetical protein C4579_02315 [Candidatus Microgenomates bacterium]
MNGSRNPQRKTTPDNDGQKLASTEPPTLLDIVALHMEEKYHLEQNQSLKEAQHIVANQLSDVIAQSKLPVGWINERLRDDHLSALERSRLIFAVIRVIDNCTNFSPIDELPDWKTGEMPDIDKDTN